MRENIVFQIIAPHLHDVLEKIPIRQLDYRYLISHTCHNHQLSSFLKVATANMGQRLSACSVHIQKKWFKTKFFTEVISNRTKDIQ
ncbi:hypothetical protein CEXT_328571 [Caerostris extrusa]|uniref:Uncharacterized protein n=1 Tax=Caerostris extrusa TaxID=172846 RepID=A0AAV4NZE3_CAEEX|nr:hypothetical protein CEXT_328571 [Caerostris extrusa]